MVKDTKLVRVYVNDHAWLLNHKGDQDIGDKIHQLIYAEHSAPFDALEMENRKLRHDCEEKDKQLKLLRMLLEECRGEK